MAARDAPASPSCPLQAAAAQEVQEALCVEKEALAAQLEVARTQVGG